MHRRSDLRRLLVLGFALAIGSASAAWAEERTLFENGRIGTQQPGSIFDVTPRAAAAQAVTTTTAVNEHQFGVGIRLGGPHEGAGVSVRYFFYGGPLGVQAEVSWFGLDIGNSNFDFDGVQFAPSVLYRFQPYEFEAPVSLTPYAGIGLSFMHTDFEGLLPDDSDTDLGITIYGGVELFFERVPNLGAGGQLTFNSNGDIEFGNFDRDLGGLTFTALAHWYFW